MEPTEHSAYISPSSMAPKPTKSDLNRQLDRVCAGDRSDPYQNDQLYSDIAQTILSIGGDSYMVTAGKLASEVSASRNVRSMNALNLLDYLVKNCGISMYLEISTHEFLQNLTFELTMPRIFQNAALSRKIMELLELWSCVLCRLPLVGAMYNNIKDTYDRLKLSNTKSTGSKLKNYHIFMCEEMSFHPEDIKDKLKYTIELRIGQLIRKNTKCSLETANSMIESVYGGALIQRLDFDKEAMNQVKEYKKYVRALNSLLSSKRPDERFKIDSRLDILYKVVSVIKQKLEIALEKGNMRNDVEDSIRRFYSRTKESLEVYRSFIYNIPHKEKPVDHKSGRQMSERDADSICIEKARSSSLSDIKCPSGGPLAASQRPHCSSLIFEEHAVGKTVRAASSTPDLATGHMFHNKEAIEDVKAENILDILFGDSEVEKDNVNQINENATRNPCDTQLSQYEDVIKESIYTIKIISLLTCTIGS